MIARFVSSIASSPTVRLDTNDDTVWKLTNQSRFDPPPVKRARVSTLLTDGAVYPATAYEDRVLQLDWVLQAATPDAAATQVQLLARELDRAENLFEYRLNSATNSVFFRTRRLGLEGMELVRDGSAFWVRAAVPAAPFGLGLPQTLSSVTVNNDPAAGSNGMFFDVSGVLGDVETPLVLRVNHADTVETWGRQSLFAVRRRGTVANVPFSLQAESMTQGTNTTVQPNDAVMSGAGSNYSRCTFGTTSMTTRLSTTAHPSSGGEDPRGRYRVLMRYRKSVSGDTINVRLQWGSNAEPITNTSVALPSGTGRRYVDLGDVQVPIGADGVTKLDGTTREVLGIHLAVQAERAAGTGNLDMDVLLLVPADDRLAVVQWYPTTGPTYSWVDGVNDAVFATDGSERTTRAQLVALGGLPAVSPGVTNRIFVIGDVHPSATNDDITKTMTIVPSYLPRYLYVRPAST